ncbi:adenosylcobinamide amidohydrolase [Streptomyces sp. NPDC058417]|uniref:adenosylcobinamide amidohydrolase n=2 Tax=Streptomyces TaxID=1883 RepID=UPI0036688F97
MIAPSEPGARVPHSVPPPTGGAPTAADLPPATVELFERAEDGRTLPALLWRAGPGWRMVSSAVLGGGLGARHWVLNAQVSHGYRRTDPAAHLAEIAAGAGLTGAGVGLLTAADVTARARTRDGGVDAVVTAGIEVRGWAAVPDAGVRVPAPAGSGGGTHVPGTVNVLAVVPAALSDAALVNAVATAVEAKVQALVEAGHDCSGTPTDAVCVAARTPRPGEETHAFAGPRSLWGARLARAVHRAVLTAAPARPSGPDRGSRSGGRVHAL